MMNSQHGRNCAASHFQHDGCKLATKFQGGSGCIMNSRCASSKFQHDSGFASTQFQYGSGCFNNVKSKKTNSSILDGGCFKNVDGKKSKSSIMDGRCIGVPDVQPTEFNPARWKLNNYLYVMKNYFESFLKFSPTVNY